MSSEPGTTRPRRRTLTGWGRTAPSVATVARPRTAQEAAQALASAGPGSRGAIARGLGRAYGDAAQSGGGLVVDARSLDAIGAVDAAAGTVTVGGGARLGDVLRAVLREGWCLPVLPGTRHVTAAGVIAADVHGKNHHRDGGFGDHVASFALLTPRHLQSGARVVTREDDRALFEATTGGMGLTGVITAATLRLHPVETRYVRVEQHRTASVDAALAALALADARHQYSVAWLDLSSRERGGRGIVSAADHLRLDDTPYRLRATALQGRAPHAWSVPFVAPVNLVTRGAVRLFNELRFRRPLPADTVMTFEDYLAPLDALGEWHRLYGPAGLVQYQCVLPAGEEAALRGMIEAIAAAPAPAALAVLKRLGSASGAPLSFPLEGWTLAVDFPAGEPALGPFLDGLDEQVARAGGRVYLAKDARMRPEMVPQMYPRLDAWRATQAEIDPDGLLSSDLDRRLHLTARTAR